MGKLHNLFHKSDKGGETAQPNQAEQQEKQEDIITELFGDYVVPPEGAEQAPSPAAELEWSEADGFPEAASEPEQPGVPDPAAAEGNPAGDGGFDDFDTTELPAEEIQAAAEQDELPHGAEEAQAPAEQETGLAAAETAEAGGIDYSAYAPKAAAEEIREVKFIDLDEAAGISKKQKRQKKDGGFFRRRKKAVIGAAVSIGVIGLIVAVVLVFNANIDPLRDYTQMTVGRGNVIQTIASGGTLEPAARYEITSLVAGQITEVNYEVGDSVREGDILFQLDDAEAQLAVDKAENEVDKAKNLESKASSSASGLKIYATATGTINDISIRSGSTFDGGEAAQITREDGTVVSVVPSVSGKVKSVSVRNGQRVTNGQLIATLTSDELETAKEGQTLDVKSAQLNLEAAKKQLENYSIKAPVSGIILARNGKIGDKVGVGDNSNPMMTIADMSSMRFTITVDEFDIWDMEIGQMAIVTADAIPKQTFSGEVTHIASEGKVNDAGVTTFEVGLTVADPGDLKAGMNVSAKIILQSATNVLTIPAESLIEPDGQNALILVKNAEMEEDLNPEASASAEPEGESGEDSYSWIKVPKGCSLIPVRYGITDGSNVEITSGLSEGDIIVYQPNADVAEMIASGTATGPASSASPQASTGPGGIVIPNSGSNGSGSNNSDGGSNDKNSNNRNSNNSGSMQLDL